MKQLKLLYLFATVLLCGIIYFFNNRAVSNTEAGNSTFSSWDNNSLMTGQVEIKSYPGDNNEITFWLTAKKVIIDWGDGNTDEFTPKESDRYGVRCTHIYSNQNLQTIKVNTKGMSKFEYLSFYLLSNNSVWISGGVLHELRYGNCPELKSIWINNKSSTNSNGKLILLDVKNCVNLERLCCSDNQLTSLDISNCKNLIRLLCSNNRLTSLDVSKCTALTELYCSHNILKFLDVNNCATLTYLSCSCNYLTSLDVSKCTALKEIYCFTNDLSTKALNNLFYSLPARNQSDKAIISCRWNPGSLDCDRIIAINRWWEVDYN